jgi:hypothetical protein
MSKTSDVQNPPSDRTADEPSSETAAKNRRDEAVIAAEFEGLDNDLVDMTRLSHPAAREDDGLGPADEDEDEPGLPGSDVDETSAGGLRYPGETADKP